jgi:hypothetical protein
MDRPEFAYRVGTWLPRLMTQEAARDWIVETLEQFKARLVAELPLLMAQEAQAFDLAVDAARVSADDACMRRHRYIRENLRASQSALAELRRLQILRLEQGESLGLDPPADATQGQERAAVTAPASPAAAAPGDASRSEAGAAEVVGAPAVPGAFRNRPDGGGNELESGAPSASAPPATGAGLTRAPDAASG